MGAKLYSEMKYTIERKGWWIQYSTIHIAVFVVLFSLFLFLRLLLQFNAAAVAGWSCCGFCCYFSGFCCYCSGFCCYCSGCSFCFVLVVVSAALGVHAPSLCPVQIWDSDLASIAERSANICIWNHTNTGQNLYATTDARPINLTAAILAWYNEKRYYNDYYTTKQCNPPNEPCLHYSQVSESLCTWVGYIYIIYVRLKILIACP